MHLHSLTDPKLPLAADTSVVINLVASGIPEQIIANLSHPFLVVDEVIVELERGRKNGCKDAQVLHGLIEKGLVKRVSLNDQGWECFGDLVCGSAVTSLDDGEAATLAYCVINQTIPIIDEKKANRVCKDRFPDLKPISSAAVFRLAENSQSIPKTNLSNAVHSALIHARMFVMPHHLDWVVEKIGQKRAASCNSLSKRTKRLISSGE